MEIGGGRVGELAAEEWKDATVISIMDRKAGEEEVMSVVDGIVGREAWNHAVCTKETIQEVAVNLYESPELMRYAYWDGLGVFLDGSDKDRGQFGTVIGSLFTSALTNFVSLPRSEDWSIAYELMGGGGEGERGGYVPFGGGGKRFERGEHPREEFRHFEKEFLSMETEVTGGMTGVHVDVVGERGIVRVDLVNATRSVHHHYDFKKDGHKRTYTMHVRSRGDGEEFGSGGGGGSGEEGREHLNNGRWTRVWLTRDQDGHKIPYNTIKSVTLIAILRMGLVPELKSHAYKEFINMPLYEDMAPWNIVMEGKTFNYIDYDTRDKTFDKFIPYAYQILSVLMNYKRTVNDFDKCGGKASTPYGFGLISDCVGSEYKGPCEDPEKPVPCATKEGTCQSDFISCLRAIGEEAIDEGGGLGGAGMAGLWGEELEGNGGGGRGGDGGSGKGKGGFTLEDDDT